MRLNQKQHRKNKNEKKNENPNSRPNNTAENKTNVAKKLFDKLVFDLPNKRIAKFINGNNEKLKDNEELVAFEPKLRRREKRCVRCPSRWSNNINNHDEVDPWAWRDPPKQRFSSTANPDLFGSFSSSLRFIFTLLLLLLSYSLFFSPYVLILEYRNAKRTISGFEDAAMQWWWWLWDALRSGFSKQNWITLDLIIWFFIVVVIFVLNIKLHSHSRTPRRSGTTRMRSDL